MEYSLTTLDDGARRLDLTVPWEEVRMDFDGIMASYRGRPLPGFRPGKVPENRIMGAFKRQIEEALVARCGERLCRKALGELQVAAAGPLSVTRPVITVGKGLSFQAEFVPLPVFELPDYTHIPLAAGDDAARRDEVSEWLLENCAVVAPDRLIRDEMDADEDPEASEEGRLAWEAAGKRARLLLILGKIARADGITADDRDIRERIEKIAAIQGQQAARLEADLCLRGALPRLGVMLLAEKTLAYLMDINR